MRQLSRTLNNAFFFSFVVLIIGDGAVFRPAHRAFKKIFIPIKMFKKKEE